MGFHVFSHCLRHYRHAPFQHLLVRVGLCVKPSVVLHAPTAPGCAALWQRNKLHLPELFVVTCCIQFKLPQSSARSLESLLGTSVSPTATASQLGALFRVTTRNLSWPHGSFLTSAMKRFSSFLFEQVSKIALVFRTPKVWNFEYRSLAREHSTDAKVFACADYHLWRITGSELYIDDCCWYDERDHRNKQQIYMQGESRENTV